MEYASAKALKVTDGWAQVEVELSDLRPLGSASGTLASWDTLTEISITPNLPAESKTSEMTPSKGWTRGSEPRIRNLRWEGGVYGTSQKASSALSEAERTKAFNDSIKASLEQEKRERNGK